MIHLAITMDTLDTEAIPVPIPVDVDEDEDTTFGPADLVDRWALNRSEMKVDMRLMDVVVTDGDMAYLADAMSMLNPRVAFEWRMHNVTIQDGDGTDAFLAVMHERAITAVHIKNCMFPPLFVGRMLRRVGSATRGWRLLAIRCGITHEDMHMIDYSKVEFRTLREVDLSDNPLIGDVGMERFLIEYMISKKLSGKLESLSFPNTGITSNLIPTFARLFDNPRAYRKLGVIELGRNPALFVPTAKVPRPVQLLFKNMLFRASDPGGWIPTLAILELDDTGLNDENVYWLAKLMGSSSLRVLNLSSNKAITNSGAWYIWEAIANEGAYTKVWLEDTSVSKAVIKDVDIAMSRMLAMYDNLTVSSLVPEESKEWEYLTDLITFIQRYHKLRKLDFDTTLCHVSPQETVNVDEPLFFATSCDYGLYFQYYRWTNDNFLQMEWTGKPFASQPIFGAHIDRFRANNWNPKATTKTVGGVTTTRRAPEYVNAVTASLASARHTPVFVHYDKHGTHFPMNPYVKLKFGTYEEAFIYSLEKINGIDGYISVDALSGGRYVFPSGEDWTFITRVTEVIVLRPSQLFADLHVRIVPKEELESVGRSLVPVIAEEGYRQYMESIGGIGEVEEDAEKYGMSIGRMPTKMTYQANVQKGGFF